MKIVLFLIAALLPHLLLGKSMTEEDFKSVVESLKQEGLHEISEHDIYEAAIEGVLNSLEKKNKKSQKLRPFARRANELMAPRKASEVDSELKGNISGIGIGINFDPTQGHQYPVVNALVEGGGAQSAGVLKNDQILKVDGKSVSQFESFADLVYAIRGPSGSKIKLHILRKGDVLVKNIERRQINWESFEVSDLDSSTIYVEVSLFNEKTTSQLTKIVQSAKKQNKSLVIDLSSCQGGLFYEGVKAIELFAKKGDEFLVTRDRKGIKKSFTAQKTGPGSQLDVVVLVGEETKSIAEAFAGALREINGAVLVGQKTLGKATMESLIKLKNGYSVKFTVGIMNLPHQVTWNKKGITPDIPVAQGEDGKSLALNVIKRLLKRI